MPVAQRTQKPKPKPKAPESDPRFAKVLGQVKQGASKVKQHPAPAKKAAEAQAAAKAPPNEKMAGAKANQAEVMDKAKPKEPDPNSFEALLLAEIDKLVPQTLDDADKFMEGGESEQVKGNVAGSIKEQKDAAASDIESATSKAPNPGAVPGKQVQEMPVDPAATPPPANGGEAMPTPKPEAEVSQKQTKVDADEALKKEKLTPARLKKANDPRFSAVLTEKGKVDKVADASPGKYRAGEKGVLTQAVTKAQAETRQGMSALANTKNKSNKGVSEQQKAAKERDEKRRAAVTENIDKIFDQTKGAVERILKNVETEAISAFDRGATAALATMRRNSDREVESFKERRYGGAAGKAQWVIDLFSPAPPELKAIIQANLRAFSVEMRTLARNVAQKVDARLKQAKDEIAKGQARISAYVKSLPKDLQAVGKAAEQAVASRFQELEKGIEDRKNALAQKLAERYKAAQDSADALAAQLEKENEGAFAGLAEAIGGVIKILLEFKDKLMALLRKGADTIELILADPIGFLGNLIGAIKAGISGFLGNIWTHLKAGFMKWLFGALGGAGIAIPADLSLPSILKLALDVLGITYERMRAKAVKMIGERNVKILEKLYECLKELVTGGPAALWAKIKQDLSDLKAMVIDAIQDWLVTTIIKAAVTKLLSMFNPAGAIVQAVMAIYNTVMFLIERASQIMEFVEAVINSISAIASGATGAAAAAVERALANAIPIVIGFLAALIGLGGIGAKIKSIIKKVQAKVDAAIDKAIAKIVGVVKKLFGSGKGKDGKPDERTEKQKEADAAKAEGEATKLLQDPKASPRSVKKKLPAIKSKYKLTALEIVVAGTSGAEEEDYIEATINPKAKGPKVKKLLKMEMVTLNFKRKPDMDEDEFVDQVRMQQTGIRDMTIAMWLGNRSAFFARKRAAKKRGVKNPEGRDPSGKAEMERVRQADLNQRTRRIFDELWMAESTALANKIKSKKPTMSYDEAKLKARNQLELKARKKAEKEASTMVPLHRVDQVAGGRGDDIARMGDARINSAIGAAWESKSKDVEKAAKKVADEERKTEKVQVTLTVNGTPV
jgi:hypothetical protein